MNPALFPNNTTTTLPQECQGRPGGGTQTGGALGMQQPVQTISSSSSSHQLHHQHQQQQQQHTYGSVEGDDEYDEDGVPAVTFKMLMKRGGKDDRSRELHVSALCFWSLVLRSAVCGGLVALPQSLQQCM